MSNTQVNEVLSAQQMNILFPWQ
uniref:Uncharacterized protein n=1 Tax=Rhizophora mucronata TaxID=61149 RepID=A0A2P2MU42_RHIMU